MKVELNVREVYKAVASYMALRGFEIEDGFEVEKEYGSFKSIHVKITKNRDFSLEAIKKFANQ